MGEELVLPTRFIASVTSELHYLSGMPVIGVKSYMSVTFC